MIENREMKQIAEYEKGETSHKELVGGSMRGGRTVESTLSLRRRNVEPFPNGCGKKRHTLLHISKYVNRGTWMLN